MKNPDTKTLRFIAKQLKKEAKRIRKSSLSKSGGY